MVDKRPVRGADTTGNVEVAYSLKVGKSSPETDYKEECPSTPPPAKQIIWDNKVSFLSFEALPGLFLWFA